MTLIGSIRPNYSPPAIAPSPKSGAILPDPAKTGDSLIFAIANEAHVQPTRDGHDAVLWRYASDPNVTLNRLERSSLSALAFSPEMSERIWRAQNQTQIPIASFADISDQFKDYRDKIQK